jgi:hypothetical protein
MLFVIAATGLAITISHRTADGANERSVVVNAADAAAYSGASWMARHLNVIAYTNRALLANHIAVGHFTAYLSWLRYVEDTSDGLASVTRYIPYVNQATSAAARIADAALKGTELFGRGYINGIDGLHGLMMSTQASARLAVQPPMIDRIMRVVAQRHDPAIALNEPAATNALPEPYQTVIRGYLASRYRETLRHIRGARPGDDGRQFHRWITATIRHDRRLRRWLAGGDRRGFPRYGSGRREWDFKIPLIIKIRKQGATSLADRTDAGGWRSLDRFQKADYDLGKGEWSGWDTLARGRADADRIAGNYRGVQRYTQLKADSDQHKGFTVPAIASLADGPHRHGINHFTRARVVYHPPHRCRRPCPAGAADHPTLFSPFWRPRLSTAPTAFGHE